MDHSVIPIEKIKAAVERALKLSRNHEAACAAAAQALCITPEAVRDAMAMVEAMQGEAA